MDVLPAASVQRLRFLVLLSLVLTVIATHLIYAKGSADDHRISQHLPVTASLFQFTICILGLAPNRSITLASVFLWHFLPATLLNGWTVALVFVSTASVSLWMLQRCAEPDTESDSERSASIVRWSAAADTTLESPVYRLLYLFHLFNLPFKQTSQFRQALLDLFGSVMFAGALVYAFPWDHSKYSVAQRNVFTIVAVLGIVSTALLDWRFATTLKALEQEEKSKIKAESGSSKQDALN